MRRTLCLAAVILVVTLLCELATARVKPMRGSFNDGRIKHVVVYCLENRAFDHLLGGLPHVDGAAGYQNPINESDPAAGSVRSSPTAPYVNICDPDHSTLGTLYKVFGEEAFKAGNFSVPTMNGFVQYQKDVKGDGKDKRYCDVMEYLAPERVPVISTLATEFAVLDRFFASHAGPTWPNRLYLLSGTSMGLTETGNWYMNEIGRLFPQQTIFDQVAAAGLDWRAYYNDTLWEMFLESIAKNPDKTAPLTEFFADAARGTLPNFSYINPRMGINITLGQGSNDLHPNHDVALGEAFYKDIYEALRASPQWNETLFLIVADEAGGFHDHVPIVNSAPAPGDMTPSYPVANYTFERLGMRLPALAISPWIAKGRVVNRPTPRQRPTVTSEFDLTSVMATVRQLLPGMQNMPPLTKRDAWAASFADILYELDAPRTDCPMHLPNAPPPTPSFAQLEAALPVNDLQQHAMTSHAHLAGVAFPDHIERQGDVSEWLQRHHGIHRAQTLAWKVAKGHSVAKHATAGVAVAVPPMNISMYVGLNHTQWHVTTASNTTDSAVAPFATIATKKDTFQGLWMCLDAGTLPIVSGRAVSVAPCALSHHPETNVDPAQHWIRGTDLSIRPAANSSLCVTNNYLTEGFGSAVLLEVCDPRHLDLRQNWSVQGLDPGYGKTYDHVISMGVATIHLFTL